MGNMDLFGRIATTAGSSNIQVVVRTLVVVVVVVVVWTVAVGIALVIIVVRHGCSKNRFVGGRSGMEWIEQRGICVRTVSIRRKERLLSVCKGEAIVSVSDQPSCISANCKRAKGAKFENGDTDTGKLAIICTQPLGSGIQ